MKSLAIVAFTTGLSTLSWNLVGDPQPASAPWDYAILLSAMNSEALDLVTGDTLPLPMPIHPCDRPGYAIAAWGGIWKVGGVGTKAVEMYDPDQGSWTEWTPLPLARTRPAVAFSQGKLYTFGGEEDSIYGSFCAVSDGGSWSLLPGIKTYKAGSGPYSKQYYLAQKGRVAIPLLDGRIALAGGVTNGTRVDLFDPRTHAWSAGPALPEPVAYGYLVGGSILWNSDTGNFWNLAQ